MTHIIREDGEHFIVPSYRDVLSVKRQSLLRREITLLANNYGEYITLQKKGSSQYEVAFSQEPGYLLGETVWQYFKRPRDLIYCEILPDSTEVILVIVKSGSVYLDGTFLIDSIPEELVIFQTQQNNFEIYLYGDVPIAEYPEPGKFSFDSASIKSFNLLPKPIFAELPLIKAFQLQLVDTILKQQGIGGFPVKGLIIGIAFLAGIYSIWSYISSHKKSLPQVFVTAMNPYSTYLSALESPAPETEMKWLVAKINSLFSLPGWIPVEINYSSGALVANVQSLGASAETLYAWAYQNDSKISLGDKGFVLTFMANPSFARRSTINTISNLTEVIAKLIDRLTQVMPGNILKPDKIVSQSKFLQQQLTISFTGISPTTLDLIGKQFTSLPLVLSNVTITVENGSLSGSIVLNALGN